MLSVKPLLKVEHINKCFGITQALKDVSFDLSYGEIHGLVGENGSGKSTLASIISAKTQPDCGNMYFEEKPYTLKDNLAVSKSGICMIMQEKGTFDDLSVAKNIFIGKEELFKTKSGLISNKKMNEAAACVLKFINAEHIIPDLPIAALNFEDRKLVELARSMYEQPKVLIIDETTTAMSRNGRDILLNIMKNIKKSGKSVIFISHDINELIETCDRLSILRDGVNIDTLEKKDFSPSKIRRLMVGREISDHYYRTDFQTSLNKEVVFSMKHVFSKALNGISFDLHKGEILGFCGLAESGMHALGNLAFGLSKPDWGRVLAGDGTIISEPMTAVKKKFAYISKNRDIESLILSASIKDNICVASYKKLKSLGPFIRKKNERQFISKCAEKLEIKMRDLDQYVMELSGGNKQKVALAKWLGFGADIFIMDCPTRGIDIGVKSNIYKLMESLRNEGKSIILISEELPEAIGMSDRIIILKDGQISGEFSRDEKLTEQKLINYMI